MWISPEVISPARAASPPGSEAAMDQLGLTAALFAADATCAAQCRRASARRPRRPSPQRLADDREWDFPPSPQPGAISSGPAQSNRLP